MSGATEISPGDLVMLTRHGRDQFFNAGKGLRTFVRWSRKGEAVLTSGRSESYWHPSFWEPATIHPFHEVHLQARWCDGCEGLDPGLHREAAGHLWIAVCNSCWWSAKPSFDRASLRPLVRDHSLTLMEISA